MTIATSLVLYASIWAIVFFMVLPIGMVSQHEDGDVLPGTPASAPANPVIVRKIFITTIVAALAFAAIWPVLHFKLVTIEDIPFLTPPSVEG